MAITDELAQGEAHMDSYRDALAKRDYGTAIRELVEAAKIDGRRFAPFPVGKSLPQRGFSAGSAGCAFLCRDKNRNRPVVVKAVRSEDLERSVDEIFAEVQTLQQLDDPAIIRVQDFGYVAPECHGRPFIVTDYFDGVALQSFVNTHGPLTAAELIALAEPVAAGLQAAHARDILHRNISPVTMLVKCSAKDDGNAQWDVKLTDFGMAPPPNSNRKSAEYLAPEQKQAGGAVTKASDVYSFAKTCCFAMFQTTQPSAEQWTSIPPMLADLLQRCIAPNPVDRPVDFTILSRCLDRLRSEIPAESPAPVTTAPPQPTVRTRIVSPPPRPRSEGEREEEYDDAPTKRGLPIWVWLVA